MPWEKVKVTGVKGFNKAIDGEQIDSGKVFIEEALDDRHNDSEQFSEGYATVAYPLDNTAAARQLLGMGLARGPLTLEVEFRRVTNGKTSRTVVSQVRAPAQPKAA